MLDINLYYDALCDAILIGFACVSSKGSEILPLYFDNIEVIKNAIAKDAARYQVEQDLEPLLLCVAKNDLVFEKTLPEYVALDNQSLKQEISTMIYKLPTRPDGALNLLGSIVNYINLLSGNHVFNATRCVRSLRINVCESYESFLNRQSSLQSIEIVHDAQEKKMREYDVTIDFLEKILSFSLTKSKYEQAFFRIKELFDLYKHSDKRFCACLNPLYRYNSSIGEMNTLVNSLFKSKMELRDKRLVLLAKEYSQKGEESKFAYILQELCKKGYAHFLMKIPSKNILEKAFLRSAKFCLLQDGRVAIDELSKNSVYCEHFAFGKPYHDVFENVIKTVFNKFSYIKFDSDNHFHDRIIFNHETSEKLKCEFAFCAEDKLNAAKKRIYSQNAFLFLFAKRLSDKNAPIITQETTIHSLPVDIIRYIGSFL
jgi:hypothetical protein